MIERKREIFLLVFIAWIVTWLRIIIITIDIRTGLWFLEIEVLNMQTCNTQHIIIGWIYSHSFVLNQDDLSQYHRQELLQRHFSR